MIRNIKIRVFYPYFAAGYLANRMPRHQYDLKALINSNSYHLDRQRQILYKMHIVLIDEIVVRC